MPNSSFYADGGVYDEAEVESNDTTASTGTTGAPSGFYSTGNVYDTGTVESNDTSSLPGSSAAPGSFYRDGGVFDEAAVESSDTSASSTPSQAPSGFYPSGSFYNTLNEESAVVAQLEALAGQTTANAASAATSASSAAVSAADAAAAVVDEAATRLAADDAETAARIAADALLAPLASPALTGTPTVPTASPGTDTTQAASTAFVNSVAVRYDAAQTLTEAQKSQGRANIGVVKKNYIINGAMVVSQQNGSSAGTTSGYYPVDQFRLEFSNSGTQTIQQVASVTPAGSPNRIRVTATVADASVAAGDYCMVTQRIEGLRVADLRFGSSSAKTITLQFGVKAPAGTYSVAYRNSAINRGYAAEYTISGPEANTDVVKSVTVALDQTGTWLTDTSTGVEVIWNLMCGTSFSAAPGSWQAANVIASTNQFNFMGTASNVFELFDVSLTVGTTAPEYQVMDYAETLRACQRYFYNGVPPLRGASNGTTLGRMHCFHPAPMRAKPTLTMTALLPIYNVAVATTIASIVNNQCTANVLEIDATATASMGATAGLSVGVYQLGGGNLNVDARL